MNDRLTVIIVNYNSGGLLRRCVESLQKDPLGSSSRFIIVDNASADSSADGIEQLANVEVIRLSENRGFGAANNVGLDMCTSPFALLINPDTELAAGDLSEFLESAFGERSSHAGLAGCRIVGLDGAVQKTARLFPTVCREAGECLFTHKLFRRPPTWMTETVHDSASYEVGQEVDWVSGAVMFVRVEGVKAVGGFDEGFFLYAEEIDLCKRLNDAGWSVLYEPSVTVLHVGGTYTTNPQLASENQKSKLRYFLKHQGRLSMLGFSVVSSMRLLLRGTIWRVVGEAHGDELLLGRSRAALATLESLPRLVFGFFLMPKPSPSTGHRARREAV